MPSYVTASFLYDAVLAVHGFDAGTPNHVISAANDVTFKALMAHQVSAMMNYLDNAAVAVLYRWRYRLMAASAGHIITLAVGANDARETSRHI